MPLWNGESPAGKRILLLAEQGLGDQVMFASLVPDLLALNPEQIIIEAHKRIAKTLARSFPQCLVIPTMQLARFDWLRTLPPIDYYLPIAELAQFFRPNAESFPKHKGFMIADPHRIAFWKKRLDTLGNGMKIGVSWRGGLPQTRRPIRSLQLSELTPLLQLPNTHFISLQYGKIGPEIRDVEKTVGIPIANWPEGISDLDEFAALVSALDLIITVCNTTVHYAGALNMPVWVMTPKIPDWRYGLSGTTMDWYPSARMFRQPEHGDWTTVLNDVLRALAACLQERRTESPRL
jgi:ADP-heptose:LPS heptosyltransferase